MNKNEALGLPTGSVRAILALLLVGAVIALTWKTGSIPEGLSVLAGAAVTFYFQKGTSNENHKSE